VAYLDHAATTTLRPVARDAWLAAAQLTGNASSLHANGRAARRLVEESREQLAAAIGVAPSTVVFTSGGTEADNLAVVGTARARRADDPARRVLIVSAVEHKAVSEPAAALAAEGFHVVPLNVDRAGLVDPQDLKALLANLGGAVALVAVMWVNNEVGSVQPIAEIAGTCAEHGVALHCDAVQATGSVALDPNLPTTTALSGHKAGGPGGVGALVVQNPAVLQPLLRGGGHESGLRAGTLDVRGIAGMAAAVVEAVEQLGDHAAHLAGLRNALLAGIRERVPDMVVNSSAAGHPGIANVTFPGCEGDSLMMLMDAAGICVSTGSACTVGIPQPSHVLQAMGVEGPDARAALRFSFGWDSTDTDVTECLEAIPDAVARARRAAAVRQGRRS
jgi:cysteine desulfurase